MPFGMNRSSYNGGIGKNLISFLSRIHGMEFRNDSFEVTVKDAISEAKKGKNVFIYADPPYRISTAVYNESSVWLEKDDLLLFDVLDECAENNIGFAMSNVLEHKGMVNDILVKWAEKYTTVNLDYNYRNCSYQKKNKELKTTEVIVTNLKTRL